MGLLALPDVAGWTVTGRHGTLGHVVSAGEHQLVHADSLLVRGGASHVLYYHLPMSLVTGVAAASRELRVDVDIADFSAHLRPDGTVDLFPQR